VEEVVSVCAFALFFSMAVGCVEVLLPLPSCLLLSGFFCSLSGFFLCWLVVGLGEVGMCTVFVI